MFKRDISSAIKQYAKFPVLALLGPRQSGKTTLAKTIFKNHIFLSFEDFEIRQFASNDPKGFLKNYENEYGIIIDEFQHVPTFLSYIQLEVDEKKRPGYFILTGSQNFFNPKHGLETVCSGTPARHFGKMTDGVESLAGRVGILTLLPLSINELSENNLIIDNVDQVIFNGGYPRLYNENFLPTELYPSYIQSYVERDIRQLINIGDLSSFQRFIQLCAGRIGQLLNINGLANECGITFSTAKQWLSILEASYIIFLLQPHYKNFSKRLTKSAKLYFFDTGLACSVLHITSEQILSIHPLRGNIFECFIISDLYKQYLNQAMRPPMYFWRDQNGRYEVDCLIDTGLSLVPIEIKSGRTIVPDFFKGLEGWAEISQTNPEDGYIIYGGNQKQARSKGTVIGWQEAGSLIKNLQ